MKSIKVILVAFLLIPAIGYAQQPQTPAEEAKQQTEWMKQNLELTPEQVEEVQEVNEEYAEKKTEILNASAEKQDKLKDLMAEREEYTEEIRDILDDEQFVKFQQAEKTWFEKTKERVTDTE